jgi:Thioredoxin
LKKRGTYDEEDGNPFGFGFLVCGGRDLFPTGRSGWSGVENHQGPGPESHPARCRFIRGWKALFILTPGEILVYSFPDGKLTDRIPVDKDLFANQKDLSDAKVEAIAQEIALNMEQFNKDLKDPAIAPLIDGDMNSGRQANVQGTPSIFVNGKLLNQRSLQGFQQAIEAELGKKK